MFQNRYILLICMMLGLTLFSCNREFNKVAKSNDMDYKFERAKEYYNNGDCFKAIPLFEELITYYKGNRDLEDIYYSYAFCQYAQKEYIVAVYHFNRFAQLYPRSEKVEEAAFMVAKFNHEQSPKYNLDQTPTLDAIEQYQRFTEKYPNSTKIGEANDAIDELREKLHRKALDNALLYYKLKDYQAAAASFKILVEDYPESKDIERAYFYIVMANKLFADNSYTSKKEDRYENALEEYQIFKKKFPESGYMKDLEKVVQSAQKELDKLESSRENN